ncbi:MAG: DUF1365 domain-containing protein [Ideonella sp.]|nr:DUF1365 domain-containing protein [Ideonella sp.]MBL0149155.1 DUF1365 domain-containing protein [Ideonella sp.]
MNAAAAAVDPAQAQPLLGIGQVRHTRLRPVRHAFAYPTWFVMLPMRSLRARAGRPVPGLAINRPGLVSFQHRDHGLGGDDALAWLDALLRDAGITDADGEAWLHTYPRVWGFAFKPVSFWYAHAADGTLKAVVAEVNNTFGERHAYLLHGPRLAYGRECVADKVFHVSPFCSVQGRYRFRFHRTDADSPHGACTVARVDHDNDEGPLLQTSVSGRLSALTLRAVLGLCLRMPLLTLGVVARIHVQALRLWLKRTPLHRKPEPPAAWVSR